MWRWKWGGVTAHPAQLRLEVLRAGVGQRVRRQSTHFTPVLSRHGIHRSQTGEMDLAISWHAIDVEDFGDL